MIKGRNKEKMKIVTWSMVFDSKGRKSDSGSKIDSVKGEVFWKIETEQRMGISQGIKRDTSLARLQPFEGRRLD